MFGHGAFELLEGGLPFIVFLLIDGLRGLQGFVVVVGEYFGFGEAGVVDLDL